MLLTEGWAWMRYLSSPGTRETRSFIGKKGKNKKKIRYKTRGDRRGKEGVPRREKEGNREEKKGSRSAAMARSARAFGNPCAINRDDEIQELPDPPPSATIRSVSYDLEVRADDAYAVDGGKTRLVDGGRNDPGRGDGADGRFLRIDCVYLALLTTLCIVAIAILMFV